MTDSKNDSKESPSGSIDKIYTFTVLNVRDGKEKANRCWGWFRTLEEAQKSVYDDAEFWLEHGYYNYVVIEEVGPGFDIDRKEYWYQADYDADAGQYLIRPLEASPWPFIINWSMG